MLRNLLNIHLILIFLLLLTATGGCSDDISIDQGDTNKITLTFRNAVGTRSNDDNFNEALIDNLVVALYPAGTDDDAAPVIIRKFTGLSASKTVTVEMPLTEDLGERLFGDTSGATCRLYAVANIDQSLVDDTATINTLKRIPIGSTFDSRKIQDSFAMAGEGTVIYTKISDSDQSAAGSGLLYRSAARISLNVRLPESATDDAGNIWKPVLDEGGMTAMLVNGVRNSITVPGTPDNWSPAEDDYYTMSTGQATTRSFTSSGEADYPYQTDVPFYTYPNSWEETVNERHKTVIWLLIPWHKEGTQEYATYYYQAPVTDGNQLEANHAYTVNMNVDMLGSLKPEEPEEVQQLSYLVVDWSDVNIGVDMKENRYLVVNPNHYVSNNNSDVITIPFFTSHPVEIVDMKITYNRYNFYSNGKGDVVELSINSNQIANSNEKASPDVFCSGEMITDALSGQQNIVVTHPLKVWKPYNSNDQEIALTGRPNNTKPETVANSVSYYKPASPAEVAYSKYTIIFRLRHTDKHDYYEDVTIEQYPAMYIEPVRNPGGSYSTGGWGTTDYGYVFVNASKQQNWWTTYWQNSSDLGGVHGLAGNNTNPNMYIINISTLYGDTQGYIIGDPRTSFINNTLTGNPPLTQSVTAGSWSVQGLALYNGKNNRRLQYYYPTDESTSKEMMVAPRFRVASSYGVTNPLNRDNARRRMASYQEQNCPAGRWRLPTKGELQYIITLSSTGKIPVLFTVGSEYWTAHGLYTVNSNGTITKSSNTSGYVRGVYDEWYWETETDYVLIPTSSGAYEFTWGDVPRTSAL